jgi:hypothetical protein
LDERPLDVPPPPPPAVPPDEEDPEDAGVDPPEPRFVVALLTLTVTISPNERFRGTRLMLVEFTPVAFPITFWHHCLHLKEL